MVESGYEKSGLVYAMGGGIDAFKRPASGSTPYLALDTVGTNHGVVTGATLTESDTAMLFDAANEGVNCGNLNIASMYGESGKVTFNFPFKYVAEARARTLLSKYAYSGKNIGFEISIDNSNNIVIQFYENGTITWTNTVANMQITNGNTYFLSVVYDNMQATASKIKVYVNGTFVARDSSGTFTSVSTSTGNFYIGNLSTATATRYYNSFIRQVSIYQDALSAANIQTLNSDYVAGRSPSITTNLFAYYPLNQANCRSSNVIDIAGNNTVTSTGVTVTSDHNGRANRGFVSVAANSSFYQFPSNAIVRNQSKLTIELSLKKTTASDTQYLLSNYISTSDLFNVITDSTGIQITLGTTSIYARFNFTQDTNWHFAQWIFNGSGATDADKVKLILDGVERTLTFAGTIPSATPNTNGTLYAMRQGTTYSNGSSDHRYIYSTNLTLSSCLKNYNFWGSH